MDYDFSKISEFKKELNRRFKAETPKVTAIKVGPDFSSLSTTELKEWKWNARFTCQRTEDKCNAHDCVFKAVDPSKACGGFCDQKHELIEAEIKRREDWEKGVERRYSDPIGIPQGLMVSSPFPFPTKESFSMKNCVVNQSTPDIIAVDYEEEEEVELAKW